MIWAISDIHGMYDSLISLLKQTQIKDSDTVIFLGDYVDRGPYSKKVLDLLIALSKQKNRIFLKGNHDDMMVDYYQKTHEYGDGVWFYNGALSTIRSFDNNIGEEYITFLKDLPLYYEMEVGNEKYLFVHAGVNPNKPLSEQNKRDLLWIRDEFLGMPERYNNYTVIHGHTPTFYLTGEDKIFVKRDKNKKVISIDIDTGCVYGGKLTAYGISEDNRNVVLQAV
ncbi:MULTISPECIES: metallophosphoesterase family protein [Petrotoga]|uniref:Serine/threonine protein phosphatase 1 n=4 Tax=Petrotoga TaxID=28236 RepID=A0A4V3GPF2_9BACT|nr:MULTISPECIES: metallophosphoesterase family protein [Petrotoga]PNR95550.1 metallophosphoesterase [Petrotoga olearia DSM 13574]POZ87782.1 metallophosphoesterase [Petrotoga sibirica DSM 13575]RMA71338.1 serine/threonine protein phosphatase 1 [Petrotoga olearia]TDX10923.1 serine/threonine protein phosphatase 1 [Petrotoga sibirica]